MNNNSGNRRSAQPKIQQHTECRKIQFETGSFLPFSLSSHIQHEIQQHLCSNQMYAHQAYPGVCVDNFMFKFNTLTTITIHKLSVTITYNNLSTAQHTWMKIKTSCPPTAFQDNTHTHTHSQMNERYENRIGKRKAFQRLINFNPEVKENFHAVWCILLSACSRNRMSSCYMP